MHLERMTLADAGWATSLLAAAFDGHAPMTHMFREPGALAKLTYFMRCTCRYALLYGEGYRSGDRAGAALWLVPGATRMTPLRMLRAGMLAAPFRLGMRDFKAFSAFASHTGRVHQQSLPQPHYYLFCLGVRAQSRGGGVGGGLIQPLLERAAREGVPVYLETQSLPNVRYYERFGFEVVNDEVIPELALQNWGMVRR